jgi:NADPH2:quinone reductase
MKALLCKQFGPPESLVVEEVADPTPAKGQVVIRVHAAGVNFPDALIIQNMYQFKPPLPFSPGGECAGIIEAIGEGVRHLKPGDRVIALTGHGAFAELALADAKAVLPLPTEVDFATAASFLMTYATSYHALQDRGALKEGETLLVLGASGGVGLAAIEIGKVLGAKVIAAASSDEKLAVCKEHGADVLINYNTEDLKEKVKSITEGKGVDVVYDPVGGNYTEAALRSCGWRGRLLVVGFANGQIPKLPANLTLLKGCSVIGVFWGEYTKREPQRFIGDVTTLFQWYQEAKLRPYISGTYSLERGGEGIRALMERRVSGKLVIKP